MTKRVTLCELSEIVGITPTSISRVLNSRPVRVSAEKRQQILQLARDLNYKPNLLARSLRYSRSQSIGLIAPLFEMEMDPIELVCRQHSYALIVMASGNDRSDQEEHLDRLRQRGVDGVLIMHPRPASNELVELHRTGFPITLIDDENSYDEIDMFQLQTQVGVELLVEHLVSLGHRRIAATFIGGQNIGAKPRWQGWINGLNHAGVEYEEDWYIPLELVLGKMEDSALRRGYEAAMSFASRFRKDDPLRPTAFMASVDSVAIAAIAAFHDLGWSVPGDISVVGMRASPIGEYCSVPLTTVDLGHMDNYIRAAEHLIGLIEGKAPNEKSAIRHVPVSLVVRRSTAPPRKPLQNELL